MNFINSLLIVHKLNKITVYLDMKQRKDMLIFTVIF